MEQSVAPQPELDWGSLLCLIFEIEEDGLEV